MQAIIAYCQAGIAEQGIHDEGVQEPLDEETPPPRVQRLNQYPLAGGIRHGNLSDPVAEEGRRVFIVNEEIEHPV